MKRIAALILLVLAASCWGVADSNLIFELSCDANDLDLQITNTKVVAETKYTYACASDINVSCDSNTWYTAVATSPTNEVSTQASISLKLQSALTWGVSTSGGKDVWVKGCNGHTVNDMNDLILANPTTPLRIYPTADGKGGIHQKITSRNMLYLKGGSSYVYTPQPILTGTTPKYILSSNEKKSNDMNGVYIYTSNDGQNWTQSGSGPVFRRSNNNIINVTSVMKYSDDMYYLVYETFAFNDWYDANYLSSKFGLAQSADLVTWVEMNDITLADANYNGHFLNPRWHVEPNWSVHIFTGMEVAGNHCLYELHPNTTGDFNSWSAPTKININQSDDQEPYDPYILKVDSNYIMTYIGDPCGTGTSTIQIAESNSLNGPYNIILCNNWSGFYPETPKLYKWKNNTYRLYYSVSQLGTMGYQESNNLTIWDANFKSLCIGDQQYFNLSGAGEIFTLTDDSTHKFSVAGKTGNAIDLDGSHYIDSKTTLQSTFQDSFTVTGWWDANDGRPDSLQYLFGVNSTSDSIVCAYIAANDGRLHAWYETDGEATDATTDANFLPDGQTGWYMIAMVVTAVSTDSARVDLYVNGTLRNSAVNTAPPAHYSSTYNLIIGGRNTDGTVEGYFKGKIDDVKIYNRALTSREVYYLYHNHYPPQAMESWGWLGFD